MMLPRSFKKAVIDPRSAESDATASRRFKKNKVVALLVALATILSLWYDVDITGDLKKALGSRNLSIYLGNGTCEWIPAIQYTDAGFPTNDNLTKTIIAGYPSGDKRLVFLQLEGLTGLSARDEWEFLFLGMTNQPFIKANYPHHEGIWGWGDVGDQVVLVVSELKKVLVEYHDILWDIGYAQTFEEAYERIENLYKEETDGYIHENPPVEDFLLWRDLRAFDEIHWYSWFIDYYMEAGLQRDMFTHELTVPGQWQMSILPNFFTKYEVRHGRFVDENETVPESYDPMCATLSKGCYPVLVIDPAKLVEPGYGPIESRKLAELVNGTQGFENWMIEEEAWECIWNELIIERKGIKTFLDRDTLDYESYTYSFEMKNEMWHQINRLIQKYEVQNDQVAIDLVEILKGHRDALGVDTPVEPITYEYLMGYHLAFPPFFPNQKPFKSDDDFFVRVHEKYENPNATNIDNIIARRRAWFEEEMDKKRERKVEIKYYAADGWDSLPAGGLASLTPYGTDTTTKIDYSGGRGAEFAKSGRTERVAALFSGNLYVDPIVTRICVLSEDGARLWIDDTLAIDNDGLFKNPSRKCKTGLTEGVYKIDIEYFSKFDDCTLVLEWGDSSSLRVVPPRSWASNDGARRYRELTILNDRLEDDLRNLKETDFMGPTTRAEWNKRRNSEGRRLMEEEKSYDIKDFKDFDEIRKLPKSEQLNIARDLFS